MGNDLSDVAKGYIAKYGEGTQPGSRLRELYVRYVKRREEAILDATAAASSLSVGLLLSDPSALTPQMEEAFHRTYDDADLQATLTEWQELAPDVMSGHLSQWKGAYFEVIVRDDLMNGKQFGDVSLTEGQRVELGAFRQEGWDLQIINADGSPDLELQAKAVGTLGPIKEHLQTYPDIQVIATQEAADGAANQFDSEVINSQVSNDSLNTQLKAGMDEELTSGFEEMVDVLLPGSGIPLAIITIGETAKVVMGRSTFQQAMTNGVQRTVKTSAAMAAGAVAGLATTGFVGPPTVFLTRIGIDRFGAHRQVDRRLVEDMDTLRNLQADGSSDRP